jgi:hypothetical protein
VNSNLTPKNKLNSTQKQIKASTIECPAPISNPSADSISKPNKKPMNATKKFIQFPIKKICILHPKHPT